MDGSLQSCWTTPQDDYVIDIGFHLLLLNIYLVNSNHRQTWIQQNERVLAKLEVTSSLDLARGISEALLGRLVEGDGDPLNAFAN